MQIANLSEQPKTIKAGDVIAGSQDIEQMLDKDTAGADVIGETLPLHLQAVYDEVLSRVHLKPAAARQFSQLLLKH